MPKVVKKLGQVTEKIGWYEIKGQQYYQDALALGQTLRLLPYVDGVAIDNMDADAVLKLLGARIGEVLEIVLVPSGMTQEDHIKNLETPGKVERAETFMNNLSHLDLMEIVEDFFVCNLDSSFFNRVLKVIRVMFQQKPTATEADSASGTNTSESLPSSPEATPLIVPQSLAGNS